jgi:GT2 family glycosyltransferase
VRVPRYSFVIATYKRPDVLAECLNRIAGLLYDSRAIEVLVIDNGEEQNSSAVAEPYRTRFPLRYFVNTRNRGMGFSYNRGFRESRGARIVVMNDDALLYPEFLSDCDTVLDSDEEIGCLGCRAIEKNYAHEGSGIGHIGDAGEVIGNFDEDCGSPIEVEHVYGFCYVITRRALDCVGPFDEVLLTRSYASGNRIETDQCLSVRRSGFKVIYNPRMAVLHLAKPRADMSEVSLRWKLNHTRNTLYMFLKHFGVSGRRWLSLRYTFVIDVGLLSAVRHPTAPNIKYFLWGLRARISAYFHYLLYLIHGRRRSHSGLRISPMEEETI